MSLHVKKDAEIKKDLIFSIEVVILNALNFIQTVYLV